MDREHLRRLATKASSEVELLYYALGEPAVRRLLASAAQRLTRAENWRWALDHGFQLGLPEESGRTWVTREPVWDLQSRVRRATFPDGDPDPNAERGLERQRYVWLVGQALHYGLALGLTKVDAVAVLASALLDGNMQQPPELVRLSQRLRARQHCGEAGENHVGQRRSQEKFEAPMRNKRVKQKNASKEARKSLSESNGRTVRAAVARVASATPEQKTRGQPAKVRNRFQNSREQSKLNDNSLADQERSPTIAPSPAFPRGVDAIAGAGFPLKLPIRPQDPSKTQDLDHLKSGLGSISG
jgi:hypothetical protein